MQLSEELAANLKKLKAILGETQALAQRIEGVLQQRELESSAQQGGGRTRRNGGG
jgi:hypothetical protein